MLAGLDPEGGLLVVALGFPAQRGHVVAFLAFAPDVGLGPDLGLARVFNQALGIGEGVRRSPREPGGFRRHLYFVGVKFARSPAGGTVLPGFPVGADGSPPRGSEPRTVQPQFPDLARLQA